MQRRTTLTGLAFLSPWVLGFLAFTLYPLVATVYYSFTDYSLFGAPHFIGLSNYRELMHDPSFLQAVGNTVFFIALAVPLSIALATSLALLLHRRLRGRAIYRTIVFAPSVLPSAAVAAVWVWILSPQWGLLNGILRAVGAPTPPWLSSPHWARIAVLIMSLWMIGSDTVLYLARLQDIPPEYYESADIDGANAWQRTWYITLPQLTPVMFFQLINALVWAVQLFSIPYIVGNQGQGQPAGGLNFYAIYLFQNAFVYLRMGYASAMATLMFIAVIILTAFLIRSSRRWVFYGK